MLRTDKNEGGLVPLRVPPFGEVLADVRSV